MQLTIKTNFADVQRSLDRLQKDIREKATYSILNKTLAQARTEMSKQIRAEYNLTATEVRDRLSVQLPRVRGSQLVIEGRLIGSGKGGRGRSLNVVRFIEKSISFSTAKRRIKAGEGGRQQLRNGGFNAKALKLRVKIKKGAPKILDGAFIANKGRTVFEREPGAKRLPIKAVQTIDVPQMFNSKRNINAVLALINRQFPVIAQREIAFFTRKFGGAA